MLKTKTKNVTGTHKFVPADLARNFSSYTGRASRSEEAIDEMVSSMLALGQVESITYRLDDQKLAVPITGHTRIMAACRINELSLTGVRFGEDGRKIEIKYGPENPFLIRGEYSPCNEVEALFHAFTENEVRTGLTDADYALFIKVVSETTGLSDRDIAARLGKSPAFVSSRRKLLDLDRETLSSLAEGDIAFDTAMTLGSLQASDRRAVMSLAVETITKQRNHKVVASVDAGRMSLNAALMAVESPVKVTAAAAKSAARTLKVDNTGKPRTRTAVEVFKMLSLQLASLEAGPVKDFFLVVLDYKASRLDDDQFLAVLTKLETDTKYIRNEPHS